MQTTRLLAVIAIGFSLVAADGAGAAPADPSATLLTCDGPGVDTSTTCETITNIP